MPPKRPTGKPATKAKVTARDYGQAAPSRTAIIEDPVAMETPAHSNKQVNAKHSTGKKTLRSPTTATAPLPLPSRKNTNDGMVSAVPMSPPSSNAGWKPVVASRGKKQPHNRPPLEVADAPKPIVFDRPKWGNRNNEDAEPEEMNTHISEKIGKGAPAKDVDEANDWNSNQYIYPPHPLVSRYEREVPEGDAPWRHRSETPTSAEVLTADIDLPANVIKGPWGSAEEYLEAHYELLREDSFSTLRDAVGLMKLQPELNDTSEICIYESVRILGVTFSLRGGVAVKVGFSLNRAQKKIRWKQSKRLVPGTLVVLSTNNFEDVKLATVLARPVSALELNPPEVDLLFKEEEIELDPTKTWVMIESRSSYFEAYKHTLKALQRMDEKNFPMWEHICNLEKEIPPPAYIKNDPVLDLSSIFPDVEDKDLVTNVNVLGKWPKIKETTLDKSQLLALKRVLTKRLAIVQGPPGTGKTHTSTVALRALISNMKEEDPPIIVACQTNHALDQLLRKIIDFEGDVIRMGGRTQDRDEIKKRTLYEERRLSPIKIKGYEFARIKGELKRLTKKMTDIIEPLRTDLMSPEVLHKLGLITNGQLQAFHKRANDWVQVKDDDLPNGDMTAWLEGYVYPCEAHQDIYNDIEEEDIEEEKLAELEAEFRGANAEDEFDDGLHGDWAPSGRRFRVEDPMGVEESEILEYLKDDNVWDWPEHIRAAVYRHLEATAVEKIVEKFRPLNIQYGRLIKDLGIARAEKDAYILQRAKVVGLTTTGLAKYRSLVASVCPRVVMIEEAAESLEGPLITACFPTVQHLILVGDHQQLRGHCSVRELEGEPYWLGISMFERLVMNEMGFETLKTQRRMRPEIRRILKPIYPMLEDHESVLQKPHVEGMDNIDIFFYCHREPEGMDDATSRLNHHEAEMITNFTVYLSHNNIKLEDITILTFYSGQKNLIGRLLSRNPELKHHKRLPRIATVDSYQGEENEIILLSLVRSNDGKKIGFLEVSNRVCVALSRAKRGFYIFGDAEMIAGVSELWWDVGDILTERQRIGYKLPLTCQKHKTKVPIQHLNDWAGNMGGCDVTCGEGMPCGHVCALKCHPFEHSQITCYEPCIREMECGHSCERQCWQKCFCRQCKTADEEKLFDERINAETQRAKEEEEELAATNNLKGPLSGTRPSGIARVKLPASYDRFLNRSMTTDIRSLEVTAPGVIRKGKEPSVRFARAAQPASEPLSTQQTNIPTGRSTTKQSPPPPPPQEEPGLLLVDFEDDPTTSSANNTHMDDEDVWAFKPVQSHTYDWGEPTPVEKKKEKKKEKVVEVDDPWGLGAVAGVTSRSGTESRSGVPERSLLD